ncbi:MAG TPA: phosphatase PAP2 family protein [Solirubrobacteraceae bacterium]|nr:phosphatase PAP2 family protein [Solirubrobacteraceae bacterium]
MALVILVIAFVCTREVGLPVRDPDHVAALYLALVGFGVACLVGIDVLIRAAQGAGTFPPPREELARVRRERWTRGRCLAAGSALLGFYVSYMAYRNLKSIVPLLRPDVNYDRELAEFDRGMFAGHDPAALLHDLLGTGLTTHVLSAAYVAFIVFLPLTIGVSLVFVRDLRAGLFYTTAQSINWLLGAGSYFLLPALGPIYADPAAFSHLPASEVTRLQGVLLDQRVAFLQDPAGSTPQAIAAFVSLHISMSFTAAVAAHLLGAGRRLKIALWTWLAVTTVGTVYLGWHYFVDDIAGVALGAVALALAAGLSGIDPRGARWRSTARLRRTPVPATEQGALLTRGDSA